MTRRKKLGFLRALVKFISDGRYVKNPNHIFEDEDGEALEKAVRGCRACVSGFGEMKGFPYWAGPRELSQIVYASGSGFADATGPQMRRFALRAIKLIKKGQG